MRIVGRLSAIIFKRTNREDKKRVLDEIATGFINGLSREEKHELIKGWIESFFADMTREDKQKIVQDIMPRIKDGFNAALILPQMLAALMRPDNYSNLSSMMPTVFSKETGNGHSDQDELSDRK